MSAPFNLRILCPMNKLTVTLMLLLVVAYGCASREVLDSIDGTVPLDVDLSGTWRIRADMVDEQRQLQDALRKASGLTANEFDEIVPRTKKRKKRRSKGGLVHVFLETGDQLKITQTPHAVFVSFDRSIVEEFGFGENRMISIGEIQAQRVTGWDGSSLVVETLDKNSVKLSDRYQLINNGNSMQRSITFRSKDLEEDTIVQEYTREN